MIIEADYYRAERHKCNSWRYLGVETIQEIDSENSFLFPSKVTVLYSDDRSYANIRVIDRKRRRVHATMWKEGNKERVDTRMPILLEEGQTLELTSGKLSMDLSFCSTEAGSRTERVEEGIWLNQIQE